jgi:hypothetical protein
MTKINPIYSGLIFITLLLGVSWGYNYHQILSYPPCSLHAWRQADCLSFTLNFFNENLNFFEPQVNNLGNSGDGKTVSEFPLIYFTVAKLWHAFGQNELIFRLINILIVYFGLFNLYRLTRSVLKDNFYAIFIPLFLFASPALAYYTNNFLADAPALGLALSGSYYMYQYLTTSQKKNIYFAFSFFVLGGLIKITSLIIFFSILGFLILELLANYKNVDKKKLKELTIGSLILLIIILLWYLYARYYNSKNSSGFFLQSIFPIWELSSSERKLITESLFTKLLRSFFNRGFLAVVFLLFVYLLISWKKVNRFLLGACVICFTGVILYVLLWFKAFDVHDYYLTNLLIFIPLILLTFFEFLKRNYLKMADFIGFKLILSGALVFLIYQTALINRMKYDDKKYFARESLVRQSDRELWEWNHWYYNNNFKAFETIKPYLRSIGIAKNDKVICMADGSINISLYLMDQKGYTKYGYARFSDKERIDFAINQGCKYLILSDENLKQSAGIEAYLTDKIGQYQNINIYSLANIKQEPKSINPE